MKYMFCKISDDQIHDLSNLYCIIFFISWSSESIMADSKYWIEKNETTSIETVIIIENVTANLIGIFIKFHLTSRLKNDLI